MILRNILLIDLERFLLVFAVNLDISILKQAKAENMVFTLQGEMMRIYILKKKRKTRRLG